jgi:DMSO/TMAO reductase YedYZ molybdopterin-dependent catalytic subunit
VISENHGFPVRLIVPGYPGQNMVKQIDRIIVRTEEERFHPDFSIVADLGRVAPPGGPAA